jgi:hypothetical protein
MNQEQLNPYYSNHYRCDNCQKEFRRTTTYSLNSSLEMTYCGDCVIENELEAKIQQLKNNSQIDEAEKQKLLTNHNSQLVSLKEQFNGYERKSRTNYLPWILGGIGIIAFLAGLV